MARNFICGVTDCKTGVNIKAVIVLVWAFVAVGDTHNYPYFSQSELNKIHKLDYRAVNRIKDYNDSVELFKKVPRLAQLIRVNLYFNRFLPQYDDVIHKQKDYWATPKEFLKSGFGDCEDYAIIKYYTLLRLGYDENEIFLTIVNIKATKRRHMVLSYFKDKNSSPLILDNLSFRILDLKSRVDLEADIFINSKGTYKITSENRLKKIAPIHPTFKRVLKKIDNNR